MSLPVTAQELTVKSFCEKANDLSASTNVRKDNNGTPCALVKVQLAVSGASFATNVIGSVDYKINEYWVYLPTGTKHLKIQHPNFVTLDVTFSDFGISTLESKSTYELVLTVPDTVPVVKDKGGNMLAMSVIPANSSLYINDELKTLDGGQHMKFYPYGEYAYRVEASGYMPQTGAFSISASEKTVLRISLESALATLTVKCPTKGCEIYVNETRKGTDSYTAQVEDGMYLIEVKKAGYRTAQETVTLGKQEIRKVSIPALEPVYGSLIVEAKPMDAEIYIDGIKRGTSPEIIENVLIGEHIVKVSMPGYKDLVRQVDIREGEQSSLSGELEKASLSAVSVASSATSSSNSATGAIKGHEYVDLGLPSGTLWATCNVGASSPSDYGDYYAWGETSTKSSYSWSNLRYRTSGDSYENITFSKYVADSKYGTVDNRPRLELSDDAANASWGGSWRMPTKDEWVELKNNCTWTWTSRDGHKGYEVKSKKNGNSIFLPAAGWRGGVSLGRAGELGSYWSSSLGTGFLCDPCNCGFHSSGVDPSNWSCRFGGRSVRPVSSSR